MIVADFSRIPSGFRLHIEGHAEYSGDGKDVVCAAASGIFYALCGYLLNFKRESLKVNVIQSGLADIECGVDCEDYLQLACLGFYQLSREYPLNVAMLNRAWAWRMMPDRRVRI